MIIQKSIVIARQSKVNIDFGIADREEELEQVFRLRYQVYVQKKNYIPAALCPDGIEKDLYDAAGACRYFLAKVGDRVIGSVRLIQADPLPIFHYYAFQEPEPLKKFGIAQKGELGRLISVGPSLGLDIPRHIVPLGLFDSILRYCDAHHITAVYGAIKEYIIKGLAKIRLPFRFIQGATMIYDPAGDDPLKNFFGNPADPVVPIYVIGDEFRPSLTALFGSIASGQTNDLLYCYPNNTRLYLEVLNRNIAHSLQGIRKMNLRKRSAAFEAE